MAWVYLIVAGRPEALANAGAVGAGCGHCRSVQGRQRRAAVAGSENHPHRHRLRGLDRHWRGGHFRGWHCVLWRFHQRLTVGIGRVDHRRDHRLEAGAGSRLKEAHPLSSRIEVFITRQGETRGTDRQKDQVGVPGVRDALTNAGRNQHPRPSRIRDRSVVFRRRCPLLRRRTRKPLDAG